MVLPFLALATIGYAVPAHPPSQIVELTEANFASVTKSKDFILVDFYSPTCGNSKALAPEFEKAANILGKRNVDLATVDCLHKGKKLCSQFNIKKWPTLKTFRHGVQTNEYFGPHLAEPIAGYVNGAEDVIAENTYYGATFQTSDAANLATSSPATGSASAGSEWPAPVASAIAAAGNTEQKPAAAAKTAAAEAKVPAATRAAAAGTVHGPILEHTAVAPAQKIAAVTPVASNAKETATVKTVPGAKSAGIVVDSPEDVIPALPFAPAAVNMVPVKPAAAASVTKISTPSAEIVNQMECAKCRILTPVQRKLSPSCRAFKRECILSGIHHASPSIQYSVNMVPGGSGK